MPFATFAALAWFALAGQPDAPFPIARLLYSDNFTAGLRQWVSELEKPGVVEASGGALQVDVRAGATIWFRHELRAPVAIEYEATMISRGGPNDRVSDLNCFWMARDARSPGKLFATLRSGRFADYNQLRAYYVGQGGNANTTTRFRRYIGDSGVRPLLPEHDLDSAEVLLKANVTQKILLVANRGRVQYYRDGGLIFDYRDSEPYSRGYFGLRTTFSHLELRHFRVYRLP